MVLLRYLTGVSFTVALTAFMFQTAVLYPWHHEFSDELKKLSKQVGDLNAHVSGIEQKREKIATHVEARALGMMLSRKHGKR